jgi:hypothetical protein
MGRFVDSLKQDEGGEQPPAAVDFIFSVGASIIYDPYIV